MKNSLEKSLEVGDSVEALLHKAGDITLMMAMMLHLYAVVQAISKKLKLIKRRDLSSAVLALFRSPFLQFLLEVSPIINA